MIIKCKMCGGDIQFNPVRAILMRENVGFHGVLRRVAGSPPVRPDLDSVHMTNVLT